MSLVVLQDLQRVDFSLLLKNHSAVKTTEEYAFRTPAHSGKKLLGHLGAFGGDDSGCGSCFSEDASDAEGLTRELSEEGQEFVMTPIEANTVGIESKMTPCMLGVTEGEEEALRGA